jgi:cation diffusion facilitator CzcD-associated flavoprotein CzcO
MSDVVDRHDLRKYMKLSHTLTGAYWNDEEGLWHVKVTGPDGVEFEDTCNLLFNGSGILKCVTLQLSRPTLYLKGVFMTLTSLSNWKWPDIQGLHDFKGKLMHSAHADETTDFTGKKVAVIGIGSSGIQVIATIASQVEQLYTWVRSPTWITAGFAQRFAGPEGGNFACKFCVLSIVTATSICNNRLTFAAGSMIDRHGKAERLF